MKRFRQIILLVFALLCSISVYSADFGVRAVYLDFRTQVMTLPAMKSFVEDASNRGMNAVVIEYEATFPFKDNLVLRNRYAFSEDEIKDFIEWCSKLGVEVIPLQNCFGHAEYILRHERYADLKEDKKDCSQVCPLKTEAAEPVFKSIFAEIAAMHPSEYLHIGCDETRLLGHCRACREYVAKNGVSKLYVNYVSKMCNIVNELGKTPMIWADIILKYPEALAELPDNVIVVDWNYGWKPDYFGAMDNIEKSGHEIWGACSMRSHPDNLYLVQWRKHLDNIFEYSAYAREHGFSGFINTSWSTSGTYGYIYDDRNEVIEIQPIREVYPYSGFDMLDTAYSAAMSGKFNDADAFLDDYCRTVLALKDESDILTVKKYFNMKQTPVYAFNGVIDRLQKELDKCLDVQKEFSALKFNGRPADVAKHLELMLDIRINYLKFKVIEAQIESETFTVYNAKALLENLRQVKKESLNLRKRFISLNRKSLKDPGQSYNEWTYSGKMDNLISTLENIH
ncbi:MAG: family 20 glycosylhydrolase [Candidatus Cryptobacteroides sp.]